DDDDIAELPIVGAAFTQVDALYRDIAPSRRRHEALRRVFGVMVSDVIDTSQALLDASRAKSVEDIRHLGYSVIQFSPDLWDDLQQIRRFLFARMYRAPSVMKKRAEVTIVVEDLFPLYLNDPALMPERWHSDIDAAQGNTALARIVSDYIAGMTDRFAIQEHARLLG
ncbi:MAG: deoxyguanosinetriphosphate triphosphohydrolase, partial [Rhodobacteraceae bacterium]|nr:deoxyguanosinetriphosphate triphosphohydrolase [Paracoccaceae bacterium]